MSGSKIKRGDTVVVIRGNAKVKNQKGRVLEVHREDNRVVVENVNQMFKHLRRSQEHPKGGRIQREAPLSLSNVMLVCPLCAASTRVGFAFIDESGSKVKKRQCKKCKGTF